MKSWKAWLLVGIIFITGAFAGGFAMRAYLAGHLPEMLQSSRKSMDEHLLDTIDREVSLTEPQRKAILPILKEAKVKGEAIRMSVRDKIEALINQTDDSIASELDPAQRVKFADLRKRMEEFRRNGPGHGGPPPPGFLPGPPPGGGPGGPGGPGMMPPGPPAPTPMQDR